MSYLFHPFTYEFMQRALAESALMGVVCGLLGVLIVLRGLTFTGESMSHTLLPGAAIAVAVGLTPEMLPMIVTVCLSKGAMAMSRKKVIIKRLNSIQNFGRIELRKILRTFGQKLPIEIGRFKHQLGKIIMRIRSELRAGDHLFGVARVLPVNLAQRLRGRLLLLART